MTSTSSTVVMHGASVTRAGFTLGPIDTTIEPGEICALVGPNGAGKSTLLHLVLGLLRPTSGMVSVLGTDPFSRDARFLSSLGWVSDDQHDIIEEFSAPEYWSFCRRLRERYVAAGDQAIEERASEMCRVLDFVAPSGVIAGFSHGMRRKTQLVAALQHAPSLIVLDEPRDGLDPIAIRRLENYLLSVARQGATVFTATHDLYWAERFADRIIFMRGGRSVAIGRPSEICGPDEDLADAFFRMVDVDA